MMDFTTDIPSGTDWDGSDDAAGMGMPMEMMPYGEPAIPLVAMIALTLAVKFAIESRPLNLNVQEAKVSAVSVLTVGLQAVLFIIALKLTSAMLLRRGILIPGLPDLVGAI